MNMKAHNGAADSGYSPKITIELILHGQRFNVASVGPTMAILRDARKMEPGAGVIQWNVDGRVTSYRVEFSQGVDPERAEQPLVLLDAVAEVAA
jgi:hypothetical protein